MGSERCSHQDKVGGRDRSVEKIEKVDGSRTYWFAEWLISIEIDHGESKIWGYRKKAVLELEIKLWETELVGCLLIKNPCQREHRQSDFCDPPMTVPPVLPSMCSGYSIVEVPVSTKLADKNTKRWQNLIYHTDLWWATTADSKVSPTRNNNKPEKNERHRETTRLCRIKWWLCHN